MGIVLVQFLPNGPATKKLFACTVLCKKRDRFVMHQPGMAGQVWLHVDGLNFSPNLAPTFLHSPVYKYFMFYIISK